MKMLKYLFWYVFDSFSGNNEDFHEIVVFSHDLPMHNGGQVNVQWPN